MEKQAKKKVLIIVGIIIVLVSLLAFILSLLIKKPETPNEPTTPPSSEISFNKEITKLTNSSEFFRVNNAINDFYQTINNGESTRLYALLENNYKVINDITKENVLNNFDANSLNSFVAKTIYYNANSNLTYYFVNGYTISNSFGSESTYLPNVNFLVIAFNNNYVIRPLNNNLDIAKYAHDYELVSVNINNDITFKNSNISEIQKLSFYISEYFNNLLFYDLDLSYSMLDNDMRGKYPNASALASDLNNIFNKYSASIFSYNKEENEDYTIYNIIDNNQNKITITEYNVMDYKISF